MKLFLTFLIFILFSFTLHAQTHYLFFYAYADGDNYNDYYREVAVTKIYKDSAQTHYLFKVLNLKDRAMQEIKNKIDHYKDFNKINSDFSSTEAEANAKMKKLLEVWEKKKTVVHHLDFVYENATGKEYPDW